VAVEEVSVFFVVSNSTGVDLSNDDWSLGFILVAHKADSGSADFEGGDPVCDVFTGSFDQVVSSFFIILIPKFIVVNVGGMGDVGNGNVFAKALVDRTFDKFINILLQLSLVGDLDWNWYLFAHRYLY
jgi:hypothetical protein